MPYITLSLTVFTRRNFVALVSSQLPSSDIMLSSVLCKFSHFFNRVSPMDGVTRGGPPLPPHPSNDTTGTSYILLQLTN